MRKPPISSPVVTGTYLLARGLGGDALRSLLGIIPGTAIYTYFRADPSALPEPERLAYWITVYNVYTIELLNSRKERKSIRNINKVLGVPTRSPWAECIVRAGGRTLSLDDVEHGIIRAGFNDARIHVALVCVALGCPILRSEAFAGDRLDGQIQAPRLPASRAKNRVDVATRTVYDSPIFS